MAYSKVIFNSKQILKNLQSLPTKNLCAVVKANAYGVGLKKVCETLKENVKFFAVATLEEALKIRAFDKTTPVLILGFCENYEIASANDISITIENLQQFEMLLTPNINSIKIHIKINTGMNRYGFKNKKNIKKILKLLKNNKKIIFEGIFTHFCFLENEVVSKNQLKKFIGFVDIVKKSFAPIVHIGGGAVTDVFQFDDYKNFMVRVGLKLYKNAIVIESKVLKVFTIKKGESLGYEDGFIAKKKTKVALVPLGYADGINRKLANAGYVKIKGNLCKIIGNVCMDVFFVDITAETNVKPGDDVLVFNDAEDWAKICGTNAYEIYTSLNFSRMEKEDL